MNKKNKQLKTLINWVKKYADVDSLTETTIEGTKIRIDVQNVYINDDKNELNLIITIAGFIQKESYVYDFEKSKWCKRCNK